MIDTTSELPDIAARDAAAVAVARAWLSEAGAAPAVAGSLTPEQVTDLVDRRWNGGLGRFLDANGDEIELTRAEMAGYPHFRTSIAIVIAAYGGVYANIVETVARAWLDRQADRHMADHARLSRRAVFARVAALNGGWAGFIDHHRAEIRRLTPRSVMLGVYCRTIIGSAHILRRSIRTQPGNHRQRL